MSRKMIVPAEKCSAFAAEMVRSASRAPFDFASASFLSALLSRPE